CCGKLKIEELFENSSRNSSIVDESCRHQLRLFYKDLISREPWALKLFDLWGKINSGYTEGNFYNLGHYSKCLDFRYQHTNNEEVIQGKYCLIALAVTPTSSNETDDKINTSDWQIIKDIVRSEGINLVNGICLPASCQVHEIVQFMNQFLYDDFMVINIECQTNDSIPLTNLDMFAIFIASTFIILLISSTSYDVINIINDREPNKLLIAFSVYTNGRKLFDLSQNSSQKSIECLNGLRVISLLWIIFGHRLTIQQFFPTTNPQTILKHYNYSYSVILSGYDIAVDTFFVMGALLITLSTLKLLEMKKLNIVRIIFHRYLRYTPVLAVLILYLVSIAKFTDNGPLKSDYGDKSCKEFWWSALLHVQNYVNPINVCLNQSWYLSADFQLFIITPFFVYLLKNSSIMFTLASITLAISSSIYILFISLTKDLRLFMTSKGALFQELIYAPTHSRMGPWIVGVLLGYFLYIHRDTKLKLNKYKNAALWILSISVLVSILMLGQPLRQKINNQSSLTFNAIYIAFSRLLWSIAISWIIFACYKLKTGGIVRWFLSLPYWQPLARMSLSMYLVHPIYQMTAMINHKDVITYEIWPMLHVYWGDVFATIFLGAFLYLTFEAPFLLIENYIYNRLHV
ncbi:CLUMA_CG002092, isoform A, partial [Clunio marinus]